MFYYKTKHNKHDSNKSIFKTTMLEIDQVSRTHACVLSQTAGSRGAEMGANDQGVCAGYTSVFTKLSSLEGNALTPSDLTR